MTTHYYILHKINVYYFSHHGGTVSPASGSSLSAVVYRDTVWPNGEISPGAAVYEAYNGWIASGELYDVIRAHYRIFIL